MMKGWSSGKLSWLDWNIRKLASFSPRLTVGEICLLLPWETCMASPRALLLAPLIAIPWKKTMCPFLWRPLLFVCLSSSFRFTLSPSLNRWFSWRQESKYLRWQFSHDSCLGYRKNICILPYCPPPNSR